MCDALKKQNSDFQQWVDVLGPIEAPISRMANRFRWQMIVKSEGIDLLHRFVRTLIFENGLHLSGNPVKVSIDVDPFFMM